MFNNERKQSKLTFTIATLIILLTLLACGGESIFTAENAQAGFETVQAAAQNAEAYATQAAPTIQALATQASLYATQSAPTLEAMATNIKDTSADAKATLQAAGIDRDYLLNKARSLKPDENGDVTITITEVELNLVLQAHLLFAEENGEDPVLQATTAKLTNGVIVISGQVERPVSGLLTIVFQPLVINNEIQMNLISATLSGNPVPEIVRAQADSTLDSTFNGTVNQLPGSVVVKQVFIGEGYMTITAGKTQ
jgi:hypothetical protein